MHVEVFNYLVVVDLVKIFSADMSLFVHADNKKIIILGKGPSQELDDTTFTAEKECSTYFTKHHKKFCLSLNYDGANSYIFVNGVKIYKFKVIILKTYKMKKHVK